MTNDARLSQSQKKEALENALKHFNIPSRYFINTVNKGNNAKFAIVTTGDTGGICTKTAFMSYDEMNAFILGYARASMKLLS
jgi:hypothetical protein